MNGRSKLYKVPVVFMNAYILRVEYCNEEAHQDSMRALRELLA